MARMLSALFDQLATKLAMSGRPQHHVGMLLERLQRVGFVVLGADGEDHAATAEFAGVFLERGVGFAERAALAEGDAFQPVIADHAAPDGVVQVQHEAFEGAALLGRQPAADQIAVERAGGGRDFLLGAVPQRGIVPFADPVAGGAVIDGENVDTLGLRHRADRTHSAALRTMLATPAADVRYCQAPADAPAGRPAGGSDSETLRAPGARPP